MTRKQLIKSFLYITGIILQITSTQAQTLVQQQKFKPKLLNFLPAAIVPLDTDIVAREKHNLVYLKQLDPERLLNNFRVNAGLDAKAKPLGGWESPSVGLRGHFVGHYLSAVAEAVQKTDDPELKQRLIYMVDELDKCQQHLGGKYLSAFPARDFDKLEREYSGVWAPYYTYHKIMQGLLDVYTKTGNLKAYQIVTRMASYVKDRMDKLPAEKIERILYTADANPPNEVGGMNDVLHQLYAVSHKPQHLQLAELFDRAWFSTPLYKNIDILPGLHANTHIVLVNGFASRYENRNEPYYRQTVINFWNMLTKHHAYVNGSSSGPRPIATTSTSRTAEHWGVADHLSATLSGETSEFCVTRNTQKLTASLMRWTGEAKYADFYQNLFYNAILPAQNKLTGQMLYHLPLGSPRKKHFLNEEDFRCCNGTGIEAFSNLLGDAYLHNDGDVWVNLYCSSKLFWKEKSLIITQQSEFPNRLTSQFKLSCDKPREFAMHLLIPSWAGAGKTQLFINGKPFNAQMEAGSYTTINRLWKEGDTIEIRFPETFGLHSMPDNNSVVSITYGPYLLALLTTQEIIYKGDRKQILGSLQRNGDDFTLSNNGATYKLMRFDKITEESYGIYGTIRNEY